MNSLELYWLPPVADNFGQSCRALKSQTNQLGVSLQLLAGYRLDENKLSNLGRLIHNCQKDHANLAPLRHLRLGVISNANTDLLEYPLIATAARYGIELTVYSSSLGQSFQQGLDPTSSINVAKPEVVLIAFDYRAFFPSTESALPGSENSAKQISDQILQLAKSFRDHSGATIMMATLAHPPGATFGNFDRRQKGSLRHTLLEINERLVDGLSPGDIILDVESLVTNIGGAIWFDARQWNHGKFPFSLGCVPMFSDHVARLLASFSGKTKKCLVLDFDNTLWGGVIGDDGIEGVVLGNGSALGEAFLDFQRYILSLRDRGIILAGCSKNDDSVAREMFRSHPESLLKEDHFAAFLANWDDKPANLRRIAQELNIGIDSLVFFDDNPFEREMVRKCLPEVVVVEVPSDPSNYRNALAQSGWFESITFSEEDRKRNEQYQSNKLRTQLASTTDVETYLRSLGMKLHAEAFKSVNRQRVVQLINKTNQFNVTTRRYTEHQVQIFEEKGSGYCEAFRLTDNFGDNGIIGVVICEESERGRWLIDTWLMSCRVLNRRVEQAMLHRLINCASQQGIQYIDGVYIPSGRNEMVATLFERLGFINVASPQTDGRTSWALSLKGFVQSDVPMEMVIS
jgi:FkbH-like protein